jgi:histidine triad (HIT) family protein
LNGAAAGQTVFHIHFHIIPRAAGIDLALHARDKADFTKLKALAERIAAAI